MKVKWDYSQLARSYGKRPNYCESLIDELRAMMGIGQQSKICDIGAGTGYLSALLAPHVKKVTAIEPNANMRIVGISQCQRHVNIEWHAAYGEKTGQPTDEFDVVTFGSSFNVVEQQLALKEAQRISKKQGWFLAIWNHRDLSAPLQNQIEQFIKREIPGYSYGNRRQDQTAMLENSSHFRRVKFVEKSMTVNQSSADFTAAWQSHATLQRQAGENHARIMQGITEIIDSQQGTVLATPYITRAWLAQFK